MKKKLLDYIKSTEHRSQQLKRGWNIRDKKNGNSKKATVD